MDRVVDRAPVIVRAYRGAETTHRDTSRGTTALSGAGGDRRLTEPDGKAPVAPGLGAEFRDAVTLRAVLLVVGVGLLQLGFIASYIGAFHRPIPHRMALAVVAPAAIRATLVDRLNAIAGHPLDAVAVASASAGTTKLLARTAYGVLVVDVTGSTDRLLEASASGVSAATAMTTVMRAVEANQHRTLRVHDLRPPLPGDSNSLSSFYLVVGWIVGGYLVSAILGVSAGSRPANTNRATVRLAAIAVYAVITGDGRGGDRRAVASRPPVRRGRTGSAGRPRGVRRRGLLDGAPGGGGHRGDRCQHPALRGHRQPQCRWCLRLAATTHLLAAGGSVDPLGSGYCPRPEASPTSGASESGPTWWSSPPTPWWASSSSTPC